MKKLLATVFALTLTASLAACVGKDSSSEKTSDSSSSAHTEEENSDISPLSDEEKKKVLDLIAGEYDITGLSKNGDNLPAEYKDITMDELKEKYKDSPIVITPEGVISLDGKDYQLIPQELDEANEKAVLCAEGSGFSLKKFRKYYKCASKEYSGLAAVEYTVTHGTLLEEDWPLTWVNVYLSNEGSEDYCVGITLSPAEE